MEDENAFPAPIAFQRALHGMDQLVLLRVVLPLDRIHWDIREFPLPSEIENFADAGFFRGGILIAPSADPVSVKVDVLEDKQAGG